MAAGAKILVNNGITFIIDDSHIATNGDWRWEGISMKESSWYDEPIKMNNSFIEDAVVPMRIGVCTFGSVAIQCLMVLNCSRREM